MAPGRDADGFLTSPTYDLETQRHALASGDATLAPHSGDWLPDGLGEVRLTVEPTGGSVFVGIGPTSEVDEYLRAVRRDAVDVHGGRSGDITYRSFDGGAPTSVPGDQQFWVASSAGTGSQQVTWDIERGSWTVAVMNTDGSPGIAISAEAGVRLGFLLPLAIGLLVGGIVLASLAAALLVWATRRETVETAPADAPVPSDTAPAYPVTVEGTLDPGLSRWMWLVKWLLAIPHTVVLTFLWIAFLLLTIVAFFAILFTGKYRRASSTSTSE